MDSLGAASAARFAGEDNLGGIEILATQGQTPGADTYDTFVGYGGRSFSILDTDGKQVFDSGAELEEKIAKLIEQGKLPEAAFNADNTGAELDERSDRKVCHAAACMRHASCVRKAGIRLEQVCSLPFCM